MSSEQLIAHYAQIIGFSAFALVGIIAGLWVLLLGTRTAFDGWQGTMLRYLHGTSCLLFGIGCAGRTGWTAIPQDVATLLIMAGVIMFLFFVMLVWRGVNLRDGGLPGRIL